MDGGEGAEVASQGPWSKIPQEALIIRVSNVFQSAFHERHNLWLLTGIM